MNAAIINYDNRHFANIIGYHTKYFEASSWLVLAISRFQIAKDEGKDMGIAAGTAVRAH